MRLSDSSQSQKGTQCIITFIYCPWNSVITEVGTDDWLPGLRNWGQETGVAVQGEARGSLGVMTAVSLDCGGSSTSLHVIKLHGVINTYTVIH